ncbi:hypothetical protein ACGF5S_17135 [Nocardia nova]|uniref:hypothetical protein n=1 Tax=Nocardia nova TaxID=37330 RepID=UPI0037104903
MGVDRVGQAMTVATVAGAASWEARARAVSARSSPSKRTASRGRIDTGLDEESPASKSISMVMSRPWGVFGPRAQLDVRAGRAVLVEAAVAEDREPARVAEVACPALGVARIGRDVVDTEWEPAQFATTGKALGAFTNAKHADGMERFAAGGSGILLSQLGSHARRGGWAMTILGEARL